MLTFSDFDSRGYPTVDVRTGYAGWAATYENTVEDVMDLALLDALTAPDWSAVHRAADLGCGTGRTGVWLREHGVPHVDGVDLTPEMLTVARERGVHDRLVEGEATSTGLEGDTYQLVIASLVDEHLPDLGAFYSEASRLATQDARFVVVSYHPQFIISTGMPTHFTDDSGESFTIATHLHLVSDHVTAALEAGWALEEMREGVIDDRWIAAKPKWAKHRNLPISAAYVWKTSH
ncbi:methyltransferase domain-containing protein [Allosaccharopolyspora coralli]|uniref:Methyltransferase domain-containing protein n=1 Tax=Allosaccharopolyspora coralli TaxID=2665642 RepID=A0A5Q3Q7T6_9PSEU|nr:class I SAM-dependent methyltransferase [Allosaccharopolyspora coralli]QGK69244.1 methyltransferase domain-containing protein [Allosaccharopolyspora coralli]